MTIFNWLRGKLLSSSKAVLNDGREQEDFPVKEVGLHQACEKVKDSLLLDNITIDGAVQSFLRKDFRSIGYADALVQASIQRRDSRIRCIVADFRHCIEMDIQQLDGQLLHVDYQEAEMHGLYAQLDEELSLRRKMLVELKNDLLNQSLLCLNHIGWVVAALAAYKEGFMMAACQKRQEDCLLSGDIVVLKM